MDNANEYLMDILANYLIFYVSRCLLIIYSRHMDLIYGYPLGIYYIFCSLWIHVLHRKNDFAKISKNLTRYRKI